MDRETPDIFRQRRAKAWASHQTSPRRVHDVLRAAIRSGEIAPGEHLVEWQLVKEYATSRNAVREALQLLAAEGLVTRGTREGTRVAGEIVRLPLDDLIREKGSPVRIKRLNDREIPSTGPLRKRLQTDADTLRVIEHLLTYSHEPIGVWLGYYRADVQQPLGWDECPDIATAFEYIYGAPLGRVDTTIEALPCEPRTMRLLGLKKPVTMLVKEHILYDVHGIPHDVSYCHYRADRVSFNISSSRLQLSA